MVWEVVHALGQISNCVIQEAQDAPKQAASVLPYVVRGWEVSETAGNPSSYVPLSGYNFGLLFSMVYLVALVMLNGRYVHGCP
jgi:hypothetical protein